MIDFRGAKTIYRFDVKFSFTWQVHRGREHGRPPRMMVLVMAVMVSTGCGGRGGVAVVAVAGRHGGRGCGSCWQVVSHGRVVRPGRGHGRSGPEPVRGVRHLTARGQVAVSHGRVIHVGRGRGAGQTVEIGLVQVRVIHVGHRCYGAVITLSRAVISSDHVRVV